MNKLDREYKEMMNVFADPKYIRQAWRAIGMAIATNPAIKPVQLYDKDGNPTAGSMIEQYSYNKLREDIKTLFKTDREPTELEMILQCQMIRARSDTSAAVFIRDVVGAKPVDESRVENVPNQFAELTDEELEVLAAYRETRARLDDSCNTIKTIVGEQTDKHVAEHAAQEASRPTDHLVDDGQLTIDDEVTDDAGDTQDT